MIGFTEANNKFNTWSSCEDLFSKYLVNELYNTTKVKSIFLRYNLRKTKLLNENDVWGRE